MSFPENPEISLRSNRLTIDKRLLRADILDFPDVDKKLPVSAEQLGSVVRVGRRAILPGIPDRGSVWVAHLATTKQTDPTTGYIFTEAGYTNAGVTTASEEVQEHFHPYWNSLYTAGFMPEIRRTVGKTDGGAWLLLRKPSTLDVLHHWLQYKENERGRDIRKRIERDPTFQKPGINAYREEGERSVDTQKDRPRSHQQIGLLLAMGALKLTLEDFAGYHTEIDDALTYASNAPDVNDATIFAIENSRFDRA